MGFRDKIREAKQERAKLKAIQKSAYEGQKKLEKQKKEEAKQRKKVEKAELAAKKGIAKAKGKFAEGSIESKIFKAAKKEATLWIGGDISPKKKDPYNSITFNGKRYTLVKIAPNKTQATAKKNSLKAKGKLVRVISRKDGFFIYARGK